MFHPEEKRPKVGVAAVVVKGEKVLMGRRLNAHGADMWCFPGGHLEWTETWEQCAARETEEEAGLSVDNVRFLAVTNDVMYADNTHYITIFMVADYAGGDPKVMEPDKMVDWGWFDWDRLPEPLFYPVTNLIDSGVSPIPDALTPGQRQIVNATKEYVRARLEGEASGHDWWHSYNVWKNVRQIAKHETCDQFTIELAALLHDISDYKLNGGDEAAGPKLALEWLEHERVDSEISKHIVEIIRSMAFKGENVDDTMDTVEGDIVQDADRLAAIGAIGIARCFAFGGVVGQGMFDPDIEPRTGLDFDRYTKKEETTSVNHFYEKLLLVKDRMKTKTGRQMAEGRHQFMEAYLEQFYAEWEGDNEIKADQESDQDGSKLVRDRIPEIIMANGEEPVTRIANESEYREALKEKLIEESKEFVEDETSEEIADVFEVLDAICQAFGFEFSEIKKKQAQKREKRGGFEKKIVLESTKKRKGE